MHEDEPALTIKRVEDEPADEIFALLERDFTHLDDSTERETRRAFLDDSIRDGTAIVARRGGVVVGFRAMGRVPHFPDVAGQLRQWLYFAADPGQRAFLERALAAEAATMGLAETTLEYFASPFHDGEPDVAEDDFFGSSLVVAPEFRRRGLGGRLLRESLDLARALGGRRFYAIVITPSPGEPMCLAGGFRPLIRMGPVHERGFARLLLAYPLRDGRDGAGHPVR